MNTYDKYLISRPKLSVSIGFCNVSNTVNCEFTSINAIIIKAIDYIVCIKEICRQFVTINIAVIKDTYLGTNSFFGAHDFPSLFMSSFFSLKLNNVTKNRNNE